MLQYEDIHIESSRLGREEQNRRDCSCFFDTNRMRFLNNCNAAANCLADIYTGGLRVLADEANPTHFQLAAHAFRELISHCSELTGAPVVYGDGMKQRLVPVRIAFTAMKQANAVTPNLPSDSVGLSVSLNDALQEFFGWADNNRPGARKRTALLLAQLAGSGPALPSDVVADDISGWMDSDEYFKLVAHHNKTAERDEFIGKLFVIENVLLRRMQPRPVSDLDAIDALIQEGENGN